MQEDRAGWEEFLSSWQTQAEESPTEIDKIQFSWKEKITWAIYWPILIFQFITLFFYYDLWGSTGLLIVGWICFALFFVFGQWPMWTFKKYGKVPEGKSYVYTTKLVTKDLFAIIRHPQFFSWILLSFAMLCLTQYVWNIPLTIVTVPLIYNEIIRADRSALEKFGHQYKLYKKFVPRVNFFLGFGRFILRRNRQQTLDSFLAKESEGGSIGEKPEELNLVQE